MEVTEKHWNPLPGKGWRSWKLMRASTLLFQVTSAFHLEMRRRWASNAVERQRKWTFLFYHPTKGEIVFPFPLNQTRRKGFNLVIKMKWKPSPCISTGSFGEMWKDVEMNSANNMRCKRGRGRSRWAVLWRLHCDANALMILTCVFGDTAKICLWFYYTD